MPYKPLEHIVWLHPGFALKSIIRSKRRISPRFGDFTVRLSDRDDERDFGRAFITCKKLEDIRDSARELSVDLRAIRAGHWIERTAEERAVLKVPHGDAEKVQKFTQCSLLEFFVPVP